MPKKNHTGSAAGTVVTSDASMTPPRVRADAQRNEEALIDAAKEVFMVSGVDAPVREIAAKAGVGLGTVYRRFPTRADLVTAVFRREVDRCVEAVDELIQTCTATEALFKWLDVYSTFLTTKKGLASALHSGNPAFSALPDYFRSKFEPLLAGLLQEAAKDGNTRSDVQAYDLLWAIASLSTGANNDVKSPERMLDLLKDGLRYNLKK